MKKIFIELLKNHSDSIVENWTKKIKQLFGKKINPAQIRTFIKSSLNILIEVAQNSNYSVADEYLIDIYNLFTKSKLSLLEISQVFSLGKTAIINFLESSKSGNIDPLILIGLIDEMFEQLYARYGVLHQEAQMKELEEDRDRLAAKLDANQQYLNNILYSSDSAIMVIDKEEKFSAWNKGAESIFGYSETDVLGKPSTLLLPEDKRYINELNLIKEEVMENGYIRLSDTERKTKNGNKITVKLNVVKLSGSNDKYAGRLVVIKDFTEVKKLQQQINQSEKLAVIGQLAAGVAHEIGNPLTSISALVQILQRKTKEKFTSEKLTVIKENIDRINKIVRELVDFSRTPGHTKELIFINDIIKTALGIVKYDKRVKKVDFETNLQNGLPALKIVPDQLLQVFVNILINAIDAVEGSGVVKVNSYKKDKYLIIEIDDNGCGMSNATKRKIFDPFFTTKDVGKGTGLGLSVSYGIIKKFNGDILVKSKPGRGSQFSIKLPLD